MSTRHVFIVSDRTGLTAEAMTHSLLTQFRGIDFQPLTMPFIDTLEKAAKAADRINTLAAETDTKPLVFVTLVDDATRDIVKGSNGIVFDLFDTFIGPMESALGVESSHSVGQSHGVTDTKAYTSRIAAVNFALNTDDGMETEQYAESDIIITGVSRCGKTPTSLYLSLQHGVFVSNYPLTDRELETKRLPEALIRHRDKLFGLTIDPFRLLQIRRERYSGKSYSSAQICETEVAQAENIFRTARIPYLNTTSMSIEEIGATIIHKAGLRRRF